MVSIALVGDVMLGRGVNEALRTLGPERPWGDVLPLLASADLRIINLECAVTDHKRAWTRTPKIFHFRADPSAIACRTRTFRSRTSSSKISCLLAK